MNDKINGGVVAAVRAVTASVVLTIDMKGAKDRKASLGHGLNILVVMVGAGEIATLLPLVSLGVAAKTGDRLPNKVQVQGNARRVRGNSPFGLRGEGWNAAGSGSDAGSS